MQAEGRREELGCMPEHQHHQAKGQGRYGHIRPPYTGFMDCPLFIQHVCCICPFFFFFSDRTSRYSSPPSTPVNALQSIPKTLLFRAAPCDIDKRDTRRFLSSDGGGGGAYVEGGQRLYFYIFNYGPGMFLKVSLVFDPKASKHHF